MNRSKNRSWMPLLIIASAAFVLFIGWSLLEGIGSALMGPALISIITETYDGIYRTKALAVVSTMAGVDESNDRSPITAYVYGNEGGGRKLPSCGSD